MRLAPSGCSVAVPFRPPDEKSARPVALSVATGVPLASVSVTIIAVSATSLRGLTSRETMTAPATCRWSWAPAGQVANDRTAATTAIARRTAFATSAQ